MPGQEKRHELIAQFIVSKPRTRIVASSQKHGQKVCPGRTTGPSPIDEALQDFIKRRERSLSAFVRRKRQFFERRK